MSVLQGAALSYLAWILCFLSLGMNMAMLAYAMKMKRMMGGR